jgi:hypothetical protein
LSRSRTVALVDTPPTLGVLTVGALVAADLVLVPVEAHVSALSAPTSHAEDGTRSTPYVAVWMRMSAILPFSQRQANMPLPSSEPACRVRLRVHVHYEDLLPSLRERRGEIDGGCGLAGTTLLHGNGHGLHCLSPLS